MGDMGEEAVVRTSLDDALHDRLRVAVDFLDVGEPTL
jgi:hypothetical protein